MIIRLLNRFFSRVAPVIEWLLGPCTATRCQWQPYPSAWPDYEIRGCARCGARERNYNAFASEGPKAWFGLDCDNLEIQLEHESKEGVWEEGRDA